MKYIINNFLSLNNILITVTIQVYYHGYISLPYHSTVQILLNIMTCILTKNSVQLILQHSVVHHHVPVFLRKQYFGSNVDSSTTLTLRPSYILAYNITPMYEYNECVGVAYVLNLMFISGFISNSSYYTSTWVSVFNYIADKFKSISYTNMRLI